MAGLKDTKRRISSVKNTQKITRAMKLVSSAKFARAHHNIGKAKPYENGLSAVFRKLGPLLDQQKEEHVLFHKRDEKKCLLLIVSTDRGLCGALNTNLLKFATNFLGEKREAGVTCELQLWGRKSHILKKKRKELVLSQEQKVLEKPDFFYCKTEAMRIAEGFREKKWDRVYLLFTRFKSVIAQQPAALEFLPFSKKGLEKSEIDWNTSIEPREMSFVDEVLASTLANTLFHVLLEGSASEHSARMTAMDSATNNADKVIKDLTLDYNRARQASITKELIEITSGAEAL